MDASGSFLIDYAAKHFVLLVCRQQAGASNESIARASCFVVEVDGHWLLVTAAHVIERFRAAAEAGVRLTQWRLVDRQASNTFPPIPFPGELDRWITVGGEIDGSGRDYAVAEIPPLLAAGLKAGGVLAIERCAWEGIAPADCDKWVLVGIPNEPGSEARIAMLVVEPCEPPPGTTATPSSDRYFGRIADLNTPGDRPVDDVGGMSGGPVFGVKAEAGRVRYWAIGVQSGWYPKARVIVFCPLWGFLAVLSDLVCSARDHSRSAN